MKYCWPATEVEDGNFIHKTNDQLSYYMYLADPDSLSNEEWAMRYEELEWIRRKEAGK